MNDDARSRSVVHGSEVCLWWLGQHDWASGTCEVHHEDHIPCPCIRTSLRATASLVRYEHSSIGEPMRVQVVW